MNLYGNALSAVFWSRRAHVVPVPKPLAERAVDTMRRSSPMNELMELDGVVPFGLKPDSELGMEQNIGGPKTA